MRHKLSRVPIVPWEAREEWRKARRAEGKPWGGNRPTTLADIRTFVARLEREGVPEDAKVRLYFLTAKMPGAVVEWDD